MTSIGDKVAHVKRASQTRNHECHWPGCDRQVPPTMWGCAPHWYELPAPLRAAIWNEYRPGQEKDGKPSVRYLAVAQLVQEWIAGRIRVLPDGRIETKETNADFENRVAAKVQQEKNGNG